MSTANSSTSSRTLSADTSIRFDRTTSRTPTRSNLQLHKRTSRREYSTSAIHIYCNLTCTQVLPGRPSALSTKKHLAAFILVNPRFLANEDQYEDHSCDPGPASFPPQTPARRVKSQTCEVQTSNKPLELSNLQRALNPIPLEICKIKSVEGHDSDATYPADLLSSTSTSLIS